MSTALTLYIILSLLFLSILLYVGWLLRKNSNISIWEKISYIVVLLVLGSIIPYSVYHVLGSPTEMEFANLPEYLNLLAVQSVDEKHTFIWINTNEIVTPKSIEVTHIKKKDRKMLQKAAQMLRNGKQVGLRKNAKGEEGGGGKGEAANGTDNKGNKGKNTDETESDQDSESVSDGSFHIVSPKYNLKDEG